jgi:hypothetical protein
MGAVQARMHFTMKQEFKLLKVIIADYTPEEYDYEPEDGSRNARRSDYDKVDVIPVSDPNAATMAQKIVQYQAVLQLAQSAPQLYDMALLHRQMVEVLGVKNADKLIKTEDDQLPTDPVTENQHLLTNEPVKAFIEQNHQAHMQVHMALIQDPKIQSMLQQNPQAQALMAAVMAHINEHTALDYRKQVETMIGMSLPSEDMNKKLSPELADQIAVMSAQAAAQITQQNQQQAQQQMVQQQMQDPIVQMQMQELQIKQSELQLKQQKQQIDAVAKADQLRIEESRIAAQKEIAAMQVAAQAASNRDKLEKQQEMEGMRMGIDAAKHKAQVASNLASQRFNQQNRTPRKEN